MFSSSRILVTSSMFFCVSSFNDEIGAELEASSAIDVCAVVDTGVVGGENDTTVVIGTVVVAGPAVVGGAVVDVIAAFDVGSAVVGGALGDAVVAAAVDVDPVIVVISATDVGGAVVVGAVVVGAVVVGAVVVGAVVDVGAAADVAVGADVGTPVVVSAADDIGSAVVDGDAAGVGAACVVCAVVVDVRASIVAVKSVTNDPVVVAESVVGMSGQTSEIVDPKLPIMPRCVVLNCS